VSQSQRKKRYLVGSRRGPGLDPQTSRQLDAFTEQTDATAVKTTPTGRRVVEMTEAQMRELAARNPHLVIEEDQELELFPMPGLPDVVPAEGSFSRRVRVLEAGSGAPVPDATLYGVGQGPAYKALTGADGTADLQTAEAALTRVIASPRDTYWSRVVEAVAVTEDEPLTVELTRLPARGYSWGHRLMQFDRVHPWLTGRDVRVAVVDSGVSDRVPDFTPRGGRNTLDGADPASWNVDENGHGTHCAGIVDSGQRPDGLRGGAPGAQVYALKVFPGGFVSDLVEAVEWAIQNRVDLVSMSLGAPAPSQVLAAALQDASARGITVVAATGNDATHVAYPAALPGVIAVGAVGRFGTFPADSAHRLKVGPFTDWRGGLFAAGFTNFGPEVAVCAPGVAVLSTVPSGYAAWDGTSMACPMVTALAALVLEAYPSARTGDAAQAEFVRSVVTGAALDLGLPPTVQGFGLPQALAAVGGAEPGHTTYWYPYAGVA
jgi:subtilisin family serine protease